MTGCQFDRTYFEQQRIINIFHRRCRILDFFGALLTVVCRPHKVHYSAKKIKLYHGSQSSGLNILEISDKIFRLVNGIVMNTYLGWWRIKKLCICRDTNECREQVHLFTVLSSITNAIFSISSVDKFCSSFSRFDDYSFKLNPLLSSRTSSFS